MLNTRGDYRIGCEYFAYMLCLLPNSSFVQLTAMASFLSCIAVVVILVRIVVRLTSFHMFSLFDEMMHSGTFDGIERRSHLVTGGCSRGLPTSTWSA